MPQLSDLIPIAIHRKNVSSGELHYIDIGFVDKYDGYDTIILWGYKHFIDGTKPCKIYRQKIDREHYSDLERYQYAFDNVQIENKWKLLDVIYLPIDNLDYTTKVSIHIDKKYTPYPLTDDKGADFVICVGDNDITDNINNKYRLHQVYNFISTIPPNYKIGCCNRPLKIYNELCKDANGDCSNIILDHCKYNDDPKCTCYMAGNDCDDVSQYKDIGNNIGNNIGNKIGNNTGNKIGNNTDNSNNGDTNGTNTINNNLIMFIILFMFITLIGIIINKNYKFYHTLSSS